MDLASRQTARAAATTANRLTLLRATLTFDSTRLKAAATLADAAPIRAKLAATRLGIDTATFEAETLRAATARDTLVASARRADLTVAAARIADLTTAAIARGGGIVYTILLALTYLPAALVLMERARDLSETATAADATEAQREQWRAAHCISFSIGTEWSKLLAVVSPMIASGGVVALLQLIK